MERSKKTTKKLVLIFVVELILIVLAILFISCNTSFDSKYATKTQFKDYVTSKNYTLEDATKSYGTKYIKSYDLATIQDKNLGIHYIVAKNNAKATNVFNNLQYQIESQKQSGSISTVSVNLIDYSYYSLENNGNYYIVVKKDNTVFAATGLSEYKDELKTMVEDLGFNYSINNLFIVLSIVIVILILMVIVMWKIFVKAGIEGWKSLIPFYNCYCLSELTFNKGWLFILLLISPINIVFMLVMSYKLAKRFGKSTIFAICSIIFPYITMQIIAFDDSKYLDFNDSK